MNNLIVGEEISQLALAIMIIIQIAAVPLLIGNLIAIQTVSSSLDVSRQHQSSESKSKSESERTAAEMALLFPSPHPSQSNVSTRTFLLPQAILLRMPDFVSDETSAPSMLAIVNDSDSRAAAKREAREEEERKQSIKQANNTKHNNVQIKNQKISNRKLKRRSLSSLLYSSESYTQATSSSFVETEDTITGNDVEEDINKTSTSISPQMMNKSIIATSTATIDGGEDASDVVPPYMKHMTIILVILHMSVFITGLVGNSLVCLSVYRNKSLQTVTNYYIVNLAVADFLVILICLPPTVYWDLTLTWNFGLVLCKLVLYLQVSCLFVCLSVCFLQTINFKLH